MNLFERQRVEVLPAKHGKKFSQLDIAVRAGLVPATIGTYEREEVLPPLKHAKVLSDALELPLTDVEQEIVQMSRRMRDRRASKTNRKPLAATK